MMQPGLEQPRIRVALGDDHPVVLAGIKALLQVAGEIELVGDAADGEAAFRLIRDQQPDVAVIDITMPLLNGLDLARRLSAEMAQVKLIALTVHEDSAYVQQLFEAGAKGYLLKRSAAEDLVRAVRAVAGGGLYIDPAIAAKALPGSPPLLGKADAETVLSPREADVLRFTARGFSNKEIAGHLSISTKSVETYKARAADKLGLRSRAQIVRYGAAKGWLAGLHDGDLPR